MQGTHPTRSLRSTTRSATLGALAALTLLLLGATPALAAQPAGKGHNPPSSGGSSTPTGNDISWPQCGGTFPSGQAFGIVGVNDGLANNLNPCLGPDRGGVSTSELYWAATTSSGGTSQPKASLYVNTADPGNGVADWPTASGTPTTGDPYGPCLTASGANSGVGANSQACAWEYGYNKAVQDGTWLTNATTAVNTAMPSSALPTSPSSYPWWLDIETANSWSTTTMNIADIQGMLAGLGSAGATSIGIYSTSYQWDQIVGTSTTYGATYGATGGPTFPVMADWIPGARNLSGAQSNCTSLSSFTGGTVAITQWFGRTFDGDYACG